MKIGCNIILECPNCSEILILSDPVTIYGFGGVVEVIQRCGECKCEMKLYFDVSLLGWDNLAKSQ